MKFHKKFWRQVLASPDFWRPPDYLAVARFSGGLGVHPRTNPPNLASSSTARNVSSTGTYLLKIRSTIHQVPLVAEVYRYTFTSNQEGYWSLRSSTTPSPKELVSFYQMYSRKIQVFNLFSCVKR